MTPCFLDTPANNCRCGHKMTDHNVIVAEGEPLKCDKCPCNSFYTANGKMIVCDFPMLMEVGLLNPGVVYINGVAFSVEAFDYMANPSPNICVMERQDETVWIRPLKELHDALVKYSREDDSDWMHSELENTIKTEARKLKSAASADDFIKIEGEQ